MKQPPPTTPPQENGYTLSLLGRFTLAHHNQSLKLSPKTRALPAV